MSRGIGIHRAPLFVLPVMPLWQGNPLEWSYVRGSALFGSLVGHIVYGLIVAFLEDRL
ncbi:hypothetical protein NKDENANG_01461 [Candidatus Entotheonellaceae bacterium PAL068K]